MKPFVTPLYSVSTEINLAFQPVVEFRARSFYDQIKDRFPKVGQFPVYVPPPEQMTQEQMASTPAIYRFSSPDEKRSVYIGPRMLAVNVQDWKGYSEYGGLVEEMLARYVEFSIEPYIERHSVGFYNRVSVASTDELRELLAFDIDLKSQINLSEFVLQAARDTDIGSLLMQLIMAPGDDTSGGPFLSINNIIRSTNASGFAEVAKMTGWLNLAYDLGRNVIWEALSDVARESWKASSGK